MRDLQVIIKYLFICVYVYLLRDQRQQKLEGISITETRNELRYILPPRSTEPKETPKYTSALTNLKMDEKC